MDKATEQLLVKSSAPTGYRRAGITFTRGDNRLADLTPAQLKQINNDPYLALVAPPAAEAAPAADGAHAGGNLDPVALGKPLTLAQAIERLDAQNPDHYTTTGLPQLDALEQLLGHKVSAKERDAAVAELKTQEG